MATLGSPPPNPPLHTDAFVQPEPTRHARPVEAASPQPARGRAGGGPRGSGPRGTAEPGQRGALCPSVPARRVHAVRVPAPGGTRHGPHVLGRTARDRARRRPHQSATAATDDAGHSQDRESGARLRLGQVDFRDEDLGPCAWPTGGSLPRSPRVPGPLPGPRLSSGRRSWPHVPPTAPGLQALLTRTAAPWWF